MPLGVDAERARRGSRDGPLSAGSSNSDPMFAPSPFRGGFRGGRGVGRGRGDWDQRGGRDRGSFYDDRDRYPRSRSQESRWGREPDDRDRRDSRYPDLVRDSRDDRDLRERENRDRDLLRPKPDRVPHDSPSTKDVSPPPLAPSAPAFGSVPSRQSTATEIQSPTGKPPPTGPRALTEERPAPAAPAGHAVGAERQPPTGPSKPALPDGGPPIPLGPRAQQKQQRSSKQWINPSLAVKKAQVESPKTARSQNFPTPQARPSGSYPPHADLHRDVDKHPRSPGARSDSHASTNDRYGSHVATGPNEIVIKSERGSQSARASVDRETKAGPSIGDTQSAGGASTDRRVREQEGRPVEERTDVAAQKPSDGAVDKTKEQPQGPPPVEKKPTVLAAPSFRVRLPAKQASTPAPDESSESDDDEDMDVYFEGEISKAEKELKKLKDAVDKVPVRIVKRYATAVHEAMLRVLNDDVSLMALVGPIPEGFTFPRPKPGTEIVDKEMHDAEPEEQEDREGEQAKREEREVQEVQEEQDEQEKPSTTRESSAIPTVEETDEGAAQPPEPQPKVEEKDADNQGLPPVPALEEANRLDEDIEMEDSAEPQAAAAPALADEQLAAEEEERSAFPPPPFDQPETERSSASPDEESEDRTEDDASIYGSVEAVREFSTTPPTEDLPVYNVKPWYKSRRVRKLAEESPEFGEFLLKHMQDQTAALRVAQDELRQEYAKNYESYLRFTASDDPAAVKSREYFTNAGSQSGSNGRGSNSDSKPEGGRRAASRFSTELDLEAAIKESIREHQERKEREERALKEKYRTDKEAVIPEMYWTPEEREGASFYDTAGLLPLEKLVATYQVVPGHVNFTEEEADRFEKAYLEAPKQWGKISKEVGTRDPGTCIMYYYAKKRELNLKEKLKRQPKRRRKGRGKQRSSALVSELGTTENETEDTTNQENGENGERRRPPRRAAAPVWGNNNNNNNNNNDLTPNADSDGATPTPTPGRRRAGTTAESKSESNAEKSEGRRGGRKPRAPKADKEAKAPKQLAQAPASAPATAPAKTGRSRANSKVQGPEWASPQTPVDIAARVPLPFEAPQAGGMQQPPLAPAQQQQPGLLTSPERAGPPVSSSSISEVMAPPSLRPEPPPPPASVPTFEIAQPAGPERIRTPQQASSYWSVQETTDFPALLRAFGTDWQKIANHMQTKTATMVKNYYVRQTKEGGKPEWEQIAMEADAKGQRGEKRPPPPTPTQGPRKRYDVSSTGHRPLAAAEPEETLLSKIEPQQNQLFSRFQIPIAQAPPVSHPLAQTTQGPPVSSPHTGIAPAQQHPHQQPQPPAPPTTSGPVATQTLSPHPHPLRPPAPVYSYPERDVEAFAQQGQQAGRTSQKPASAAATSVPAAPETAPRPAQWATDYGQQFSLLQQAKEARSARDVRERQRLEFAQRESPRPVERAPPPLRMKQEPEPALHHPDTYPQYQPLQRAMPSRMEPAPIGRQPEPARTSVTPVQQAPPQAVHAQPPGRSLLGEPAQSPQMPLSAHERTMSGSMQRQPPVSMQEQYGAAPASTAPAAAAPPPPPPPPPPPSQPQHAPAPPRAPERKVNIMSLLNDEEPPPHKRTSDVSPVKRNSTPQPMARQPAAAPLPPRREVETGYSYSRGPAPGPPSAIPPLKPYHTQSPQPHHVRVPSSGMASSMDPAAEAQRDYYARHSYPAQHTASAVNSPQPQHLHYSQHGQHVQQQQQQQHAQQAQQQQQQQQQQQTMHQHQHQPHLQQQQQQQQHQQHQHQQHQHQPQHHHHHHHHHHQPQQQQQHALPPQPQHPSQSSWPPSHQAPQKVSQPVPAQSAWGAQHGGVQTKPSVGSPLTPQQHHGWPTSGPSQQQPHPLSLRDPRPPSVYESQSPASGLPPHPHHQHHNSLGGGRYAPGPPQDAIRRSDQQPHQQQPQPQGAGVQPPYPRYASTPGPGPGQQPQSQQHQQGRDPTRSYTPVAAAGFDHRGPHPPPPPQGPMASQAPPQDPRGTQYMSQQEAAAMREHQMREAHMREMHMQAQVGGPGGSAGGGGPGGSILGRQLRPGPESGIPPGQGPGGPAGLYDRGMEGRRY
ncbi:hypothetical protein VTH06DRAFT_1007 [Thermothelomyces fergusii]